MIRLMFVATYSPHPRSVNPTRAQDSALSLMFDDFLVPAIDQTIIYYGPDHFGFDLEEFYQRYGIDTENILIRSEHTLLEQIDPELINFRPSIRQQLIKLIALDQTYSDLVMIQDCDIFAIKPYTWLVDDKVQLFAIENTQSPHPEWHQYLKKFLNLDADTQHCFMNEFLPIFRRDWLTIRSTIEQKYQMPWLDAIHHQFSQDIENGLDLEFSEFEMLSHWLVTNNRATVVGQRNIQVPAPIQTAHGVSSRDWFMERANKLQPNCVKNATQCRGTELLDVSKIIRDWIATQ